MLNCIDLFCLINANKSFLKLCFTFSCQSTLITDEYHVRNCISGTILGKVPTNLILEPFDVIILPNETTANDEESFTKIYKERTWGKTSESASGGGSSLKYTQEIMGTLHILINQIKAALNVDRISMLDVPCGDMNWMKRFLSARNDIDYTGIDIVPDIIEKHKEEFKGTPYKFINANIVKVSLVINWWPSG